MMDSMDMHRFVNRLLILNYLEQKEQSNEQAIINNFAFKKDTKFCIEQRDIYYYLDVFCRNGLVVCKSIKKQTCYTITQEGRQLLNQLHKEWVDFLFFFFSFWECKNIDFSNKKFVVINNQDYIIAMLDKRKHTIS